MWNHVSCFFIYACSVAIVTCASRIRAHPRLGLTSLPSLRLPAPRGVRSPVALTTSAARNVHYVDAAKLPPTAGIRLGGWNVADIKLFDTLNVGSRNGMATDASEQQRLTTRLGRGVDRANVEMIFPDGRNDEGNARSDMSKNMPADASSVSHLISFGLWTVSSFCCFFIAVIACSSVNRFRPRWAVVAETEDAALHHMNMSGMKQSVIAIGWQPQSIHDSNVFARGLPYVKLVCGRWFPGSPRIKGACFATQRLDMVDWARIPTLIDQEECEVPVESLAPAALTNSSSSSSLQVLSLPVLPVRSVWFPGSRPRFAVSTKRGCILYDGVLSAGSRWLVATLQSPQRKRELARIGVILQVDNLKVDRTSGRLRYIADHTVLGRVRIVCFQNPTALNSSSENLQCTVELIDTISHEESCIMEQDLDPVVADRIASLRARLLLTARKDGRPIEDNTGGDFWKLCAAWQSLLTSRLVAATRRARQASLDAWAERCPQEFEEMQRQKGALPVSVLQEIDRAKIEQRQLYGLASEAFQRVLEEAELEPRTILLEQTVSEDKAQLFRET